ncbi:MAG: hypothetical protein ACHQLQ_13930 [Candidatus Acidiferrales bacterium]
MIGFSVFVAAAFLLILLLFFLGMEEKSADEARARPGDQIRHGRPETICPREVTHSIFSQDDFQFILRLGSPRLLRIYREERKGVALHWVRRASHEIRMIMQEHARSARLSQNLNAAGEAKLLFQYIILRLICALLMIFIRFMSPPALHGIAAYLSKISDQIGHAQHEFEITTRIATPQDSGTP